MAISGAMAFIWPHYNDALRMHKWTKHFFITPGHGDKYVCCYFYIMHGHQERFWIRLTACKLELAKIRNSMKSILQMPTHKPNEFQVQVNQSIQRTAAPSAGRNQKMPILAERGHLNSDPLHGTLHHTTKFQAVMWFPSSVDMQKFAEHSYFK